MLNSPRQDNRVVVTGLGPITAFGQGIDPLWHALLEGRSALGPIERFDPGALHCQVAAELDKEDFNVRKVLPKSYRKAIKVMCRDVELALGAAHAAITHAGLNTNGIDADQPPTIPSARMGCQIGAGLIAAEVNELAAALATSQREDGSFDMHHWGREGMQNLTPLWLLKYLPNMLACHVTIVHECRGPSNTITCCEASAGLSLVESVRVIKRGHADACLTGGAEYKLNPMAIYRQEAAKRLARLDANDDPATGLRPFCNNSTGTVLGEGGGLLVAESNESALQRGAAVLAEIAGVASTQSSCLDTTGMQPREDDMALANCMDDAISRAGIDASAIDAIVPLGSGIRALDDAERRAMHHVFGVRAKNIPLITSIPATGHCGAGQGGVAMCIGVQALVTGQIPARLHTTGVDDLCANISESQDSKPQHVLVCTPSQGGQNAAVVFRAASAMKDANA